MVTASSLNLFSIDGSEPDIEIISKEQEHWNITSIMLPTPQKLPSLPPVYKTIKDSQLYVDVDAMIGPITFNDFPLAINHCININLTSNITIKAKKAYVVYSSKIISIDSLQHIKIASLTIPSGTFSIFLICPGVTTSNPDLLFAFVKNIIDSVPNIRSFLTNKDGSTVINHDDIPAFIDHIKTVTSKTRSHKKDFLFLESFANKNKTSIKYTDNSTAVINQLVNNCFDTAHFPFLKIDLAVTVNIIDSVIFPSRSFFHKMHTAPNYFLFCNKNFANAHKYNLTLKKDCLTAVSNIFEKYNFYSTVEDLLSFPKTYKCVPLISSAILKSNIYGHSPICSTKKLENLIVKVQDMLRSFVDATKKTWPYRIEARINHAEVSSALDKIVKALEEIKILSFPSEDFFDMVYKNSNNIFGLIQTSSQIDLASLFKSVVIESFFINLYLKGTTNLQILPNQLHTLARSLLSSRDELASLDVDFDKIADSIPSNDILSCLEKMIRYDGTIDDTQKTFLNNLINLNYLTSYNAAELVINQYSVDMSSKYKFTRLGFTPALRVLSTTFNSISLPSESLNIDHVIVSQFSPSYTNPRWKSLPFRAMIHLYVTESEIPPSDWLNAVKEVFLKYSLDLSFNLTPGLKQPVNIFNRLLNTSGALINTSNSNTEIIKLQREDILAKIIPTIIRNNNSSRVPWSTEEKIRLLAGRRIYLKYMSSNIFNGVWKHIASSSLYGFIFNRTLNQMKDTFIKISVMPLQTRNELEELSDQWIPENYSIENLLDGLERHGITFSNDGSIELLRQLRALDLKEYRMKTNSLVEENDDLSLITNGSSLVYEAAINRITATFKEDLALLKNEIIDSLKDYIDKKIPHSNIDNKIIPHNNSNNSSNSSTEEKIINAPSPDIIQEDTLFSLFRYRQFRLDSLLNFSIPSTDSLPAIQQMVDLKALSFNCTSQSYRFNMKVKDSFITFDYIDELLRRSFPSPQSFTSNAAFIKIPSKIRPPKSEWNNYIEDLILDNYLSSVSGKRKIKLIKLTY